MLDWLVERAAAEPGPAAGEAVPEPTPADTAPPPPADDSVADTVPVAPPVASGVPVAALDPASLGDEEFDGLLAAAGLDPSAGSDVVPERMAEVNALLDLAAPELREAVLTAFLDRLMRPNRG